MLRQWVEQSRARQPHLQRLCTTTYDRLALRLLRRGRLSYIGLMIHWCQRLPMPSCSSYVFISMIDWHLRRGKFGYDTTQTAWGFHCSALTVSCSHCLTRFTKEFLSAQLNSHLLSAYAAVRQIPQNRDTNCLYERCTPMNVTAGSLDVIVHAHTCTCI